MEDTINEIIKKLNALRYGMNPEEICSFDKAKKELLHKGRMSYRNEQFIRWMAERNASQ